MKRRDAFVGIVIVAATVAAGCGSSGSSAYSLGASQQCLAGLGATTEQKDLDETAKAAPEALGVQLPDNNATVIFDKTRPPGRAPSTL